MQVLLPLKVKEEKCIPKEQHSLVIIDTIKGQDNDILKELCDETFCKVVIVPHNLTNKFQPSDIPATANKPVKAFISIKYNSWFSKQVAQIALRTEPSTVKVYLLHSQKSNHYIPNGLWIFTTMCVKKRT